MSIHHLERAAELRLQATRKLVFMALCDDADKTTGLAMPGLEKVMAWAGCGKSQAAEHLKALIDDGLVERVSVGYRGRRAVFRVFARVACCGDHPVSVDVDDPMGTPENGSGSPESTPNGSGKGPESIRNGSGLDRTPSQPPNLPTTGEPSATTSRPRANDDPPPFDDLGGNRELVVVEPTRCAAHQAVAANGPCWSCKETREAVEAAKVVRTRAAAVAERQARREDAAALRRSAAACTMCDDDGRTANGLPCSHDPQVGDRARRGAAAAREAMRKDHGA